MADKPPTLILVVEDEGIVGLDIQRRLTNLGYSAPTVVATGALAVQRALELRPQLVLMDIRLKGDTDGIAAADHIRRLLDIPIIFLTAYADEDTLRRARVTEPYGYVLKPFEERELQIAIEMALYKFQMERKLRSSERWLATTLNSINDAIITTDTQGQINLVNPMAAALTGWLAEEAVGRSVVEVFRVLNESTRKPEHQVAADLLNKQIPAALDPVGILVSRRGDEIRIQYHVAPICDSNGNAIGSVMVFRDIAEQHKVEQELHRVQKLESLGLMAGGVAHDFNNLLSAVVNNIALVKMQLENGGTLYRRLELVEKALWRGTELTQQLLTFAKGGAPVRRIVDVDALVHQTADLVFAGSNIQVKYYTTPELWLAEIDAGQIGHAIHNLLINAKEAMPTGGTIEIGGENVIVAANQLPALTPGDYLKLTFRDQGSGIVAENIAKIFDPYFTTKPRGSGLGLATVHSIIKRHQGHIAVDSTFGQGTIFEIYLPAAEDTTIEQGITMHKEIVRNGKGRILIMDDEELIRDAIGALLEHLGYDYSVAEDGRAAIALYDQALQEGRRYNVVILDLTVPGGMGGQETLAQLLEIDPTVKAIVSSGYFHDPIVANYRDYGFSGVVAKPYTIEDMSETLHRLIQLDASDKRT